MTGGYELTLDDFRRLVTEPAYRSAVEPLLASWFGAGLDGEGAATRVIGPAGEELDSADLHRRIQSAPARQFELYQVAMTLWR